MVNKLTVIVLLCKGFFLAKKNKSKKAQSHKPILSKEGHPKEGLSFPFRPPLLYFRACSKAVQTELRSPTSDTR